MGSKKIECIVILVFRSKKSSHLASQSFLLSALYLLSAASGKFISSANLVMIHLFVRHFSQCHIIHKCLPIDFASLNCIIAVCGISFAISLYMYKVCLFQGYHVFFSLSIISNESQVNKGRTQTIRPC